MTTPPLQPVTEDPPADAEVGGDRLSGSARRGEGGSLLFEARDRSGRPAGLQISAEPVQGRRTRARFRRLARIRAELEHPSLLAVREVGEHGARPFVATAPVPSRSLASLLRDGPIDAGPAIRLLAAAARGWTPRTSAAWCT